MPGRVLGEPAGNRAYSRHQPKPGPSKYPSSAVPPRLPSGNNMARTTGCCENGLNAPSRSSSIRRKSSSSWLAGRTPLFEWEEQRCKVIESKPNESDASLALPSEAISSEKPNEDRD